MTFYEEASKQRNEDDGLNCCIEGISYMNDEMYLKFYVHEDDVAEVLVLLDNADAEWWDSVGDTGVCHAEYLQDQLDNAGICYEVEWEDDDDDEE